MFWICPAHIGFTRFLLRIIGYTNTYQTYRVLHSTGKTRLGKNPQPIQPETSETSESEDGRTPDDNMSAQVPIPVTLMPDPELPTSELPVSEDQDSEIDTPVPEKGKGKKKDAAYWDETLGKRGKSTRERKRQVLAVGTDSEMSRPEIRYKQLNGPKLEKGKGSNL